MTPCVVAAAFFAAGAGLEVEGTGEVGELLDAETVVEAELLEEADEVGKLVKLMVPVTYKTSMKKKKNKRRE